MSTQSSKSADRTAWMTESRVGLFIHWGLYSTAARHEWVKSNEQLSDAQYQPYFDHFEPDLYDPQRWAADAWDAGMRYVVITTKHHDGFCLWDTALTDFKASNTPAGRDLLRPFVDAFRQCGFYIGFYHSLIDWRHPDFPVDLYHPQREDADAIEAAKECNMDNYVEYLHGQVTELLTDYGRVDMMWFDFSYPGRGFNAKGAEHWNSQRLLALVRRLQPHIVVNDRLDLPVGQSADTSDFSTVEQVQDTGVRAVDSAPWEACQTLNGSWGYDRDNVDYKSPRLLLTMLIDTVSKDGNLLLNVGPTGRGEFDPRARESLAEFGEWMQRHAPAIRGAGRSLHTPPPDCRYTQRGDRLYLHIFSWPMKHVHLDGLADKVAYARLLNDHSQVKMVTADARDPFHEHLNQLPADTLTLELPIRPPQVTVPVVELLLK